MQTNKQKHRLIFPHKCLTAEKNQADFWYFVTEWEKADLYLCSLHFLLLSLILFFPLFPFFSPSLWVEIQFKAKWGWMKHWTQQVHHQHTQGFQWPIFHTVWREWNISIHLTLEVSRKGTVTLFSLLIFLFEV